MVDTLVDQYVKDELPPEDRDRVERYFLASEERRDKLEFALALKKRKAELRSGKHPRRKFLTFYLPIAASVLIVLGSTIVFWRSSSSRPGVDKGLVALQAAFRDQRPVEARISGFNYAPVADQRGQTAASDYVQRDRAARLLFDAVSEDPRAETHHALGKYYLAERQFDKAIDQFEAALKLDPQSAQVHSDLGAALFEKGKAHRSEQEHGEKIEDFARSLDHFNTALKLDSSLLEPLFNRALLYREMRLLDQAESDWRQYLE